MRSHEGVCYQENEDTIYKQKYAYFTHRHVTEARSAVGSLFLIGGGLRARAEGPRKFLNLVSLKCHFLDFGGSFEIILIVRFVFSI
jgi:hypothetical protein